MDQDKLAARRGAHNLRRKKLSQHRHNVGAENYAKEREHRRAAPVAVEKTTEPVAPPKPVLKPLAKFLRKLASPFKKGEKP